MREFRTYGSVRGALSNGRPYRDHVSPVSAEVVKSPRMRDLANDGVASRATESDAFAGSREKRQLPSCRAD